MDGDVEELGHELAVEFISKWASSVVQGDNHGRADTSVQQRCPFELEVWANVWEPCPIQLIGVVGLAEASQVGFFFKATEAARHLNVSPPPSGRFTTLRCLITHISVLKSICNVITIYININRSFIFSA